MTILAEGLNDLKDTMYFHPLFCHNHSITKPNICENCVKKSGDLSRMVLRSYRN